MARALRPDAGGSRGLHVAALLGLGLVCALEYSSTLQAGFHYDDSASIVRSPFIRWTQIGVAEILSATLGPLNHRPVAYYTFGLNYYLSGYEAGAFRAVNIAIHAVNSWLVYALARGTLRRLAALPGQAVAAPGAGAIAALSLLSGLLFAVHPLQTNSVTYVVQRMTSLATLFTLVALLLWVRGRESAPGGRRRALLVGAGVAGLLALGSKEIAVTLPLAAWLYEWFFLRDLDRGFARRSLVRLWLPLAAVGLGLYLFFFWGPDWGYARRDFTLGERLLTQLRVVVIYLSLIAFPHPSRLNLLHDVETSRSLWDPPTTLGCGLLLAGLLAAGVGLARRLRLVSFGILWFFLQLLLESTVLPLEMIYEHRTYLPLVGVALVLPWLGWAALGARPRLALALAALLLAALASATWVRNQTWRDNETLWRDVVAKSPRSPRAHANLGSSLQEQERYRESLPHFQEALRLDPRHADSWRGIGSSLTALGQLDEAVAALREAVRLDGRDYQAIGGLGTALVMLGRSAEAEPYLRRAIAIFPDERLLNNLGRLLDGEGRTEEALHYYGLALELSPGYASTHLNVGLLHEREGRLEQAIQHFERVLATVDDAETRAHLGSALWSTGRPREAIEQLERAHALRPRWIEASNNLAWMLATCPDPGLRDPLRALRLVDDALQQLGAPDPALLDGRAAALAALGRFDEAEAAASEALALAEARAERELAAELRARRDLYAAGTGYVERPGRDRKPVH